MKISLPLPWLRLSLAALCVFGALAPRAGAVWIALLDANGWWTDRVENDAALRMRMLVAENKKVHDVAFAPSGDWILLYGSNGYWTSKLGLPACQKIVELQAGSHQLKCVAFAPHGGWVILYDKNSFAADGIAPNVRTALEDIATKGGTLKWMAFTAESGWCLLSDRNGYGGDRLPDDCLKQLASTAAQGSELTTVSFAPNGGWAFFFDQGGFRASGIPADAQKKLEDLQKAGAPHFIAFAPPTVQFDPAESYALETEPARQVHATLTADFAIPNARVAGWYLYAPQAPDLPGQSGMKTSLEPLGELAHELSPRQRPVLFARLADHRNQLHSVLTIDGTLYSRRLRMVPPGENAPPAPDLTPDEVKEFTSAGTTINFETPAFRAWMQQNGLTRAGDEKDLNFAHRTFSFIMHHYTYEYPTDNHTSTQVCSAVKSDCGGLSSLFTGIMRANGVPARLRVGRWAKSQKPGNTVGDYGNWHVKAEFFARGVGWVPVDGSSALGNPNGENKFFGNDAGDFITFTDDGDMLLDSFIRGPQNVRAFQGITYWWHGTGNGENSRADTMWTVEEVK